MVNTKCRYFNGYKPCNKSLNCSESCEQKSEVNENILIIHLEALGAVLRATSILPAIKRKYPKSHITWVTQAPAHHLLKNIEQIDRVLTTKSDDILALGGLSFDFAFCIDKSLKAVGILARTQVNSVKGFVANEQGAILPANPEADELWQLGLSDQKKFYENKKPETQMLIESLNLGDYKKDPYQVQLSNEENQLATERKKLWAPNDELIVGINTGCSPTIAYKKLSIDGHRTLISKLQKIKGIKVVLLGGPEDTERNALIAQNLDDLVQTPTEKGLRDGLVSVGACDVVVSGDSLGMHMAIALNKYVVAWFGPTCAHEIELYGRGEGIISTANCSPCWRRSCQKAVMCYDLVNLDQIVSAVERGIHCQTSLYKPPLLETSFSPSQA